MNGPETAECPTCSSESRFVERGSASGRGHYHCPRCGPWREKNPAAVALGRLGGLKAAENMTPEQREARAIKAGNAFWDKYKPRGR